VESGVWSGPRTFCLEPRAAEGDQQALLQLGQFVRGGSPRKGHGQAEKGRWTRTKCHTSDGGVLLGAGSITGHTRPVPPRPALTASSGASRVGVQRAHSHRDVAFGGQRNRDQGRVLGPNARAVACCLSACGGRPTTVARQSGAAIACGLLGDDNRESACCYCRIRGIADFGHVATGLVPRLPRR
jgi:hypothetical protein